MFMFNIFFFLNKLKCQNHFWFIMLKLAQMLVMMFGQNYAKATGYKTFGSSWMPT